MPIQNDTSVSHSPSPWRINKDRFSGKPEYPYSIGADSNGRPVIVVPEVWGSTDDMREANAYLIAAAPELLEAAKALIAWLQNEEGEETSSDLADRMLRLQVAIAKAEGRQS